MYDILVIGGGPGGYVAAIRAAQLGFKVACVEKRGTLGGTCLNVGCIPSKAMLESSEHYDFMKHKAIEHGIELGEVKLQLDKLLARKDKVVSGLVKGVEGLFKKNKIDYLIGTASFKSPHEVKVVLKSGEEKTVQAKNFIVATGSEAINIGAFPFDAQTVISSTEALELKKVPEHLVVVGGGVIGLEMASVWKRLGSKVTVLEAMPQIVPMFDADLVKQLQRSLQKQGIEFVLNAKVQSVKLTGKNLPAVVAYQDSEGKTLSLEADKVLVAVGRKPYTTGLQLDAAGVKLDERGRIAINEHFQSSQAHIYAIGDVVRGPMLAHKAEDEGLACAEIIAGQKPHMDYLKIPNVVYTHPEVASVGQTEAEIKTLGLPYKVGTFPLAANGRAKSMEETEGLIKIIAHAESDEVLGVHMVGARVSELIAEAVIAMEFKASSEDIARTCHAHPTLSEATKEAAMAVMKRAIHF